MTNLASGEITLTATASTATNAIVYAQPYGTSTFTNLGTIKGQEAGISMTGGGLVTNGARDDTSALLDARDAVASRLYTTLTVVNYGTITGNNARIGNDPGVDLEGTGTVINGASTSTAALISGDYGIEFDHPAGTMINFGTIRAIDTFTSGVDMYYGAYGTVIDHGTVIGSRGAVWFNRSLRGPTWGDNLLEL